MRARRRRRFTAIALGQVVLLGVAWGIGRYGWGHSAFGAPRTMFHVKQLALSDAMQTVKVMVIGGSSAHGDDDKAKNSYIRRAFQSLTNSTNTNYQYIDLTRDGQTPLEVDKDTKLKTWLQKDQPDVVVFSWGMLNSVYYKTPLKDIQQAVHNDIALALKSNAVVLCVTPPVVQASATYYASKFATYIEAERQAALAFHSSHLYWFDLTQDMTNYMKAHNQDWKMYKGDSWHPNTLGHELAGRLLYNELVRTFGSAPISLG